MPDHAALPPAIANKSNRKRYFQFSLMLLAAGSIYPLLYLRQNFETPILEVFNITSSELGNFYSMLGVVFFLCYLPSGWLADKFSPRLLVTVSMAGTGLLGLLFATIPSGVMLTMVFLGWGLTSGLTFWSAMLKGVKMLAKKDEQGRFFGILDGGRGLIEAILATIAISLFAYYLNDQQDNTTEALKVVVYMYSFTCLVIAALTFIFFTRHDGSEIRAKKIKTSGNVLADLKHLASIPALWLVALIILCGYQLFWATYSFSAYVQEGYGVTAVAAGAITVAKLWMRPIGGITAGFLGDRFGKTNVLALLFLGATAFLATLILMPTSVGTVALLAVVLMIGVLTYALRGLYWAILDDCDISMEVAGLAIGVISLLAYTPDIFLPQIYGFLSARFEAVTAYQLYFGYIACMGIVGMLASLKLKAITARKEQQLQHQQA
ncbi:MFS transporter [Halomonas sp. YLB-10]|uniref:MFS transporter n=2 Tax=unclassified Halomonas TaxID=2609666 RepID=UPI000F5E79EE|nr:MFS transporter [Halomonas sp. YLB-10]RQW72203.1 MFS transporter [Halomonas sp. YLB-10]